MCSNCVHSTHLRFRVDVLVLCTALERDDRVAKFRFKYLGIVEVMCIANMYHLSITVLPTTVRLIASTE